MQPIVSVKNLSKTYASGFQALKNINLDISKGEIFALLGPNGAGKTTLISIICGIVTPSQGVVLADWTARSLDGAAVGRGTNVFELDAEGRIARAVGLWAGR